MPGASTLKHGRLLLAFDANCIVLLLILASMFSHLTLSESLSRYRLNPVPFVARGCRRGKPNLRWPGAHLFASGSGSVSSQICEGQTLNVLTKRGQHWPALRIKTRTINQSRAYSSTAFRPKVSNALKERPLRQTQLRFYVCAPVWGRLELQGPSFIVQPSAVNT